MVGRWGARSGNLTRQTFDKADLDKRANATATIETIGGVDDQRGACGFLQRWGKRLKARGMVKKRRQTKELLEAAVKSLED